jgi:hypothetical protein
VRLDLAAEHPADAVAPPGALRARAPGRNDDIVDSQNARLAGIAPPRLRCDYGDRLRDYGAITVTRLRLR